MSTILIVDDEPSARETLSAVLDGQNYRLEMAENGVEAIQMAMQIQPDLILLDVMMPGMNGFEVCRRVRSTPGLAEVPIIILTALDDPASLLQGIESGADDFLTKPVDRHELIARAQTITRLNRYRTLVEQRENLREMAERVVTAQEEERQRISRELHDDLGQALTILQIALRDLQQDLSIPAATLFERIQALHSQAYEISVKIRRLAQDLRPPVLDTLGLKLAMQTYCTEFTRRTHMPVTFEVDQVIPALSDIYNITIYRALQEALTNIIKHAKASHVWVDLSVEDSVISLTVQDNGHGFPADKPKSNGIGITGMQERLALVGGQCVLRSKPEGGTILTANLPLKTMKFNKMETV
jgi:signal transduction histidine kinase